MRHRTTPRRTALASLTFAAALATGAGAATASSPPSSGPDDSNPPVDTAFRDTAARRCTDAINAHPREPGQPDPFEAVIGVIEHAAADEVPDAATIGGWVDTLRPELEREQAIRDDLAALTSDDPAVQAAWDIVVSANDGGIARLQERIDLLNGGDWDAIAAGFPGPADPGPDTTDALVALGLGETQCLVVHSPTAAGVSDASHVFRSAVADACTTIQLRRLAADYDADADASVRAVVELLDDGAVTPSDELTAALRRVADEWRQTSAELAAIDAANAPVPAAWADVLAAAAERVTIFGDRAAATESGDADAVAAAFDLGRYEYPGFDFEAAGVDQRCQLRA